MRQVWLVLFLVACEGPAGPPGPTGPAGEDGLPGIDGEDGTDGTPSPSPWLVGPGVDIAITDFVMTSTSAKVSFTLKDTAGVPLDRTARVFENPTKL